MNSRISIPLPTNQAIRNGRQSFKYLRFTDGKGEGQNYYVQTPEHCRRIQYLSWLAHFNSMRATRYFVYEMFFVYEMSRRAIEKKLAAGIPGREDLRAVSRRTIGRWVNSIECQDWLSTRINELAISISDGWASADHGEEYKENMYRNSDEKNQQPAKNKNSNQNSHQNSHQDSYEDFPRRHRYYESVRKTAEIKANEGEVRPEREANMSR